LLLLLFLHKKKIGEAVYDDAMTLLIDLIGGGPGRGGLKMTEVIHTAALTKHYGPVRAVEQISLSVQKGEIYGFLGLNGAGKTTTIRMLLGMIRPTAGASYLNGEKIDGGNYRIWNRVGYIVEIPYAYPELTVRENLGIISKLRGISGSEAVDRIISQLQLGAYADMKAGQLSLGNAQRLGLAKALLHQPEILLLDEPANGLDPAGIVEIRALFHDLAHNHGVTIFISSHILGEVARLVSRIGIIHNGRLIQELDAGQLELLLHRRLLLDAGDRAAARSVLTGAGYAVALTEEGIMEIVDNRALEHPEAIARLLVYADCPPTRLQVEEEDLESYFLRTIREAGGDVR
jgi:ABC-2 type transport system ATP-binding protein